MLTIPMILPCVVAILVFGVTVDGFGLIQNVGEGTCLANSGGGVADGELINLVPCDITQINQQWNVFGMVDQDVIPGLIAGGRNGKCLDGSNGIPASHTYMYTCTGSATNHQWRMLNGNIASTFQLQCLYANKCLVNGGAGVGVVANADCVTGAANQTWRILPSTMNVVYTCSSVVSNPLNVLG